MNRVTEVVTFTPVYNEPARMVLNFDHEMKDVTDRLRPEVSFQHFFGSDGALTFPAGMQGVLVEHQENMGLAKTLIDGFEAVLDARPDAEVLIRLDCQEHDPHKIPDIVEAFTATQTEALFLPVWYWWGKDRPPQRDIYKWVDDFWEALAPMDPSRIMEIYNKKFPLGYQAYRTDFLRKLLPKLRKALALFEGQNQKAATWGLDLLIMLIAARNDRHLIDFMFGGYAEPWKENRSSAKEAEQAKKAKAMVYVAKSLGCKIKTGMEIG